MKIGLGGRNRLDVVGSLKSSSPDGFSGRLDWRNHVGGDGLALLPGRGSSILGKLVPLDLTGDYLQALAAPNRSTRREG